MSGFYSSRAQVEIIRDALIQKAEEVGVVENIYSYVEVAQSRVNDRRLEVLLLEGQIPMTWSDEMKIDRFCELLRRSSIKK